jgi:type II secretory pathway component PulF
MSNTEKLNRLLQILTILITVGLGAVVFFVLPNVKEVALGLKVELSWLVQVSLGFSDFIISWWFLAVPAVALCITILSVAPVESPETTAAWGIVLALLLIPTTLAVSALPNLIFIFQSAP